MRRGMDIAGAMCGLVFLTPILIVTAVSVWMVEGRPILHRGLRVGKDGRRFQILKFRSMIPQAEAVGPNVTGDDDSRVTKLGRFLRKTKFDELPQLINVLRGEMSLVGPRPECPEYVEAYTHEQRKILAVRPGITSAASYRYVNEEKWLAGDNWEETYRNEILPAKLRLDLAYIERRNVCSDIVMIVKTLHSIASKMSINW